MEQGTEFLENAFAALLFCIACTLLFRELMLYQSILEGMEQICYGVRYMGE